jgi:hypothetical protein
MADRIDHTGVVGFSRASLASSSKVVGTHAKACIPTLVSALVSLALAIGAWLLT